MKIEIPEPLALSATLEEDYSGGLQDGAQCWVVLRFGTKKLCRWNVTEAMQAVRDTYYDEDYRAERERDIVSETVGLALIKAGIGDLDGATTCP